MNRISDYVLYFPSIEFQNDNWMKSSLLFWDKIYRIVPEGYEPRDSTIVSEAQECDLIRDITLEEKEIRETGDYFLDFFERVGDKIPIPLRSGSYENLNYIHRNKFDDRLYKYLDKIENKYYRGTWLDFPQNIGKGYMFYLANVVSKNRGGMSLSTDNPNSWTTSSYFTEDGNLDILEHNPQAESFYSALILEGLMPVDMSNISINSVIKFVDEEKEKKQRLRDKLIEFSSEISRCQNSQTAKELIEDYREKIGTEKNELKESISTLNILRSNKTTFLTVGVSVAAEILMYLKGDSTEFPDIFRLGSSVYLGALAASHCFSNTRRKRKEETYVSYLLDIESAFNSDISKYHRNNVRSFKNFMRD